MSSSKVTAPPSPVYFDSVEQFQEAFRRKPNQYLHPEQQLQILGLRLALDPQHQSKPLYCFHKIAAAIVPPGYQYRMVLNQPENANGSSSSHGQTLTIQILASKEGPTLAIHSPGGLVLSGIHPTEYRSFSDFTDWLNPTSTTRTLQANEKMRIRDPAIAYLYKDYKEKYNTSFVPDAMFSSPVDFFLSHLFLPVKKKIVEEGSRLNFLVNETYIEFQATRTTSLQLSRLPMSTTIRDLGESLIRHHEPVFDAISDTPMIFRTGRILHIYDIQPSELGTLRQALFSENAASVTQGLDTFFTRRVPVGFTWNYRFANCVPDFFEYRVGNQQRHGLTLTPRQNGIVEFSLSLINRGVDWIIAELNRASPNLRNEFTEADGQAIEMLMIKMILRYATNGYRYEKNPVFFTQNLVRGINHLVEDPRFSRENLAMLLLDIDNPSLYQNDFRSNRNLLEIAPLFQLSAEDYDLKKLDGLSPDASELMNRLIALVTDELRGLPLKDALTSFWNGWRQQIYQPFLKVTNSI